VNFLARLGGTHHDGAAPAAVIDPSRNMPLKMHVHITHRKFEAIALQREVTTLCLEIWFSAFQSDETHATTHAETACRSSRINQCP
jgi:hypothetical protein